MTPDEITAYIASHEGVDVQVASGADGSPEIAWGDSFFSYDPDRTLEGARRFPFAAIVTKDYGDFDDQSKLDRDGIYRLNIGLSAATYDALFPPGSESHDFTQLDVANATPWVRREPFRVRARPQCRELRRCEAVAGAADARAMRRYRTTPAD